jgi:all-trans-retinol 13,14-reductase
MGGEIFTRSAVTKIGCNTTHATSVTTENGEVYEAKVFISNIHPSSIIEMIDPSMFRKAYRDRIRGLNNTISHFSVYIKFKPNTVPYSNCNYYNFKDNDVWGCSSYTQADWPRGYLYMHQVSRQNIEYAESAIMIAYMNFNEVERWINTTIEHRGDDYVQFKEQKQEVMLGLLERDYPGIRQHMQSVYSSSPLTQRDYTGSPRGSMYGIEKDKNYPKQTFLSHKTKIPNLFFTGQNTNAHGILGVAISAIITTEEFAGTESIISEIL